ncbi:hypothetical protein PVAP13_4NG232544 [Panicum virgatum]|uniref:PB1-like domain-containing protein n=1 Tax=Panicum virgatum TaxID=38727 RepID=A0A8T0TAG5_PANVG|nr:hypothetical protein PVAP13_4NG232544 [Panicum virgatum]
MDPLDFLAVRFHFGGEFINDGKALHYCGGKEGISSIERDKISLPEITGHLKDHFQATDPVLLHWLFPELVIVDDEEVETEGSDWEVEARKEGEVQLETPEEDKLRCKVILLG